MIIIQNSNLKFIYYYIIIMLISIFTILIGINSINLKNSENYSDFSSGWYSNGVDIDLSEVYKYENVSKIIPKLEKDTEIYMNVKSINVDIYIDDKLIYEYEEYNKDLFGKTPGSYFIKLDIPKEYSGKQITLHLDNAYQDKSGKITKIQIGDSTNIVSNFILDHFLGILISTIIIFIGLLLIVVYLLLRLYNTISTKILNLGLFALIVGIFMFTDSKFLQILNGNEYLYHMISETSMLLITVPLMLFISRAYRRICNQKIIKVLCVLGILNFIVCYMLNLFNICDYHESLILTHSTYILCVLYIIFLGIKSIIKKSRIELYHTIGLSFICIGCVVDILILYFGSMVETTLFSRLGVLIFLCFEGVRSCLEFLQIYSTQQKNSVLQKLAYEDGLTNLLNRTAFMKDMEELSNNKEGLIAVFDVNDLKTTNDKYGHAEGDKLIIAATRFIKDYLLDLGKCYRIGGDEFVFISTKSDIEESYILAYNRMLDDLAQYNKKNRKYKVSMAMGYCIISEENNIETSFNIADNKMYENKSLMKEKIKNKKKNTN